MLILHNAPRVGCEQNKQNGFILLQTSKPTANSFFYCSSSSFYWVWKTRVVVVARNKWIMRTWTRRKRRKRCGWWSVLPSSLAASAPLPPTPLASSPRSLSRSTLSTPTMTILLLRFFSFPLYTNNECVDVMP